MSQPPSAQRPTPRIEVCRKHALRYNAAEDDGCARCRTEAGQLAIAASPGRVTRQAPDLSRSLVVAALLVAGFGGGLFLAHTVAYRSGEALFDELVGASVEEVEAPDSESGQDFE